MNAAAPDWTGRVPGASVKMESLDFLLDLHLQPDSSNTEKLYMLHGKD